jgi:hypothetical protein
MSDEPNGRATSTTRQTRERLIVSVIVIGLLSGGCQGCARPKVHLELVRKGMTIAEVEAILGKPIDISEMPLRGSQLRAYRGDGDHTIYVRYKDGKADFFDDRAPQPWWRLW